MSDSDHGLGCVCDGCTKKAKCIERTPVLSWCGRDVASEPLFVSVEAATLDTSHVCGACVAAITAALRPVPTDTGVSHKRARRFYRKPDNFHAIVTWALDYGRERDKVKVLRKIRTRSGPLEEVRRKLVRGAVDDRRWARQRLLAELAKVERPVVRAGELDPWLRDAVRPILAAAFSLRDAENLGSGDDKRAARGALMDAVNKLCAMPGYGAAVWSTFGSNESDA